MSRTVSPCAITAGKIIILSIENFGTVSKNYIIIFKSIIDLTAVCLVISIIYVTRDKVIKKSCNIGFLFSKGSENDDVLFHDATFLPVMVLSHRSNHTYKINNM